MQIRNRYYDPAKHDRYKALTVKQPWADKILSGAKTIEVRSRRTSHRGDLLITSSASSKGARTGIAICIVELYDVKPLSELTREEMFATGIPEYRWADYKGYGWFLRNPVPVRPIPVKGQLGVFNLVTTKGALEITQDYKVLTLTKILAYLLGLIVLGFLLSFLF